MAQSWSLLQAAPSGEKAQAEFVQLAPKLQSVELKHLSPVLPPEHNPLPLQNKPEPQFGVVDKGSVLQASLGLALATQILDPSGPLHWAPLTHM